MKLLPHLHRKPSMAVRRGFTVVLWLLGVAAIVWVCTFKIMDRDFWWHVKAGEIMWKSARLISIEPFAYTREGLPYLATHEWLAQILLYLIYSIFGSTGIILLRGVIATACVGLLLLLAKRQRLLLGILGIWAIVITKGSFLERPQLFTFVLFCAFLVLAFRFLDAEWRTRVKIAIACVALTYLWVNLHGGAALLGIGIVGLVLLQTVVTFLQSYDRTDARRSIVLLAGTLLAMGIALILPPNGTDSITYVVQLLSDQTILFIAEHQPREIGIYLLELWPFYVLSVLALAAGRKHLLFNGLLLLTMAYLSRQAFRHEIFFVFAAVAVCVYHADRSDAIGKMWTWAEARPKRFAATMLIVVLLLGRIAYARSFGFERPDNLFGFGEFDLARGAYEFVEREKIGGNMFNTYGIGGYLLYRGYPDRKVFIDGRNVDYGFEYMARAYAAGINADRWEELEHLYDITYAIVDYDAIKQKDRLPYASILDIDPDWALVYLDDWTAVYLKKTPANQPVIDRLAYTVVNATRLEFDDFSDVPTDVQPTLIEELRRVQDDNPKGMKATVALAKIAFTEERFDDVPSLVATARAAHPTKPEPLALLAATSVRKEEWDKAADAYAELLRLAGNNYPDINYAFIADVFEKGGRPIRAWYYRLRVPKAAMPEFMSGSGATEAVSSLSVNPAVDAVQYFDEGLSHAEAGRFTEAEEAFRTSLKINPSAAETWNNLCALLMNMKRDNEAIDACKRATEIAPEFGDARYNLALAYYRSGKRSEARKEAELAQKFGRMKEGSELLLLIDKQ